jgi:hypothetical protein
VQRIRYNVIIFIKCIGGVCMAVKFMAPRTTYIGNGALADAKDDICKLGKKPLLLQDSQ